MSNLRYAAKTPKDRAGSGWYEILPPPQSHPVLDEDIHTEWLVIGAGFAGLTAASRLLQLNPDASVVILEAQKLGWGACGRNSGFMIDLPHELQGEDYASAHHDQSGHQPDSTPQSNRETNRETNQEIRLNRTAIDYASGLSEQFGLQDYFSLCGKYHGAGDQRGLQLLHSFADDLERFGEPYERLDAQNLKDITGTDFYLGGLFAPGCAMLQPAGYIRSLGEALVTQYPNCRLYESSPAIEIASGQGAKNTVRVKTSMGQIQAEKAILCINGHLGSFGWHKKELMHVYTYSSMTQALTEEQQKRLGGERHWSLIPAHTMGTTVRRVGGDRIVVRNTFTYNPNMETSDEQIARYARRHRRSFDNRFPMLEEVKMEHIWAGHLCLSRNSESVFGELEPNLFAACCHNGLGASKGTLGGLQIANLAMGQPTDITDILLNSNQPSRLPPEPFMSLGAKSYMSWLHWRAGRDL